MIPVPPVGPKPMVSLVLAVIAALVPTVGTSAAAGNPSDRFDEPLAVLSETAAPTVTVETSDAVGSSIIWAGTAADDVAIRKVRMIVRHVDTNTYWNGTTWIPASQAGTDRQMLLIADLSAPLARNPTWTYTLDTDRGGTFQTLTWAQDEAYRYSAPIPSSITRQRADEEQLLIVSLGDSYISGNGAGDYVDPGDGCWRSRNAFPFVYAEHLEDEGHDTSIAHAACGGSTTSDIDSQIAQVADVATEADIVVLTVGANDLNFAGRTGSCISEPIDGACPLKDGGDVDLRSRIDDVLVQVGLAFSNAAQVILVGYPDLDGHRCAETFELMDEAFEDLDEIQSAAIADMATAPPRAGIDYHFVSLVELYRHRGPCAVWESIEGPDAGRWIRNTEGEESEKGHPTAQGHAATARLLVELGFHTTLGPSVPAVPRVLFEVSPQGASPQTIRGSVLGGGDSVGAVRVLAKDQGSVILGRGERWWNGSAWSSTESLFDAEVVGDRWGFSWDPDDGGTGMYAVWAFPVDEQGSALSTATRHLVLSDVSSPPAPAGSVDVGAETVVLSGSVQTRGTGTLPPVSAVRAVIRHEETGDYWTGSTWTADVHDPRITMTAAFDIGGGDAAEWSYAFSPGRDGLFHSDVFVQTPLGTNSPTLSLTFER